MFADDTKLYNEVKTEKYCEAIQEDLNSLAFWSKQWLLKFNATKCFVLKIRESFNYMYTLNEQILQQANCQKDLGIIISEDLLPRKHINSIVKKANQRIGLELLKDVVQTLVRIKLVHY